MKKKSYSVIRIEMRKRKHPLDWYIDNTPSDDKEYEEGCLAAAIIMAIIFLTLVVVLIISK